MRQNRRRPALLVLMGLVATLLTFVPAGTANAAESIPALQISPAPTVPALVSTSLVESSDGSVTVPCSMETGHGESDLITYSSTGSVVRQISRTPQIDGVPSCIQTPVVDKNGDLYGFPWGRPTPGASTVYGPNLLAYDGNTLKWKYPARCGSTTNETPMTMGADGNIYVLTDVNGNIRLLGLAPELETGQTQPAVKVNIDVADNCFAELLPYRDGIIIKPQSGNLKRYSYGGKLVTDQSIARRSEGVANDDGLFFTPKSVGSSPTTMKVLATPTQQHGPQQILWEAQASTPGADVQDGFLYPLASGGVLALIKEQKLSGGVPVTPTEYHWVLAVLGPDGQLVQREYLLNSAGTTILGYPFVVPDSSGKVVVLREITVPSGVSYPATMPGIAIGVYNPATDSWVYQQSMTGDNSASGGPYGYKLEYSHYRYPATVTDDTVTFVGRCSGNCPSTGFRKLYALEVSGVSTVYPKGKILEKTQRPAAGYIALGDSFSSGEGMPPFEAGTDDALINTCHRSDLAYAYTLAGTGSIPELGSDSFRTCSGAVTENITDRGQWNEGVQLDWWPDTTTEIVTLTIGGNDIGFADFAEKCVFEVCEIGSTPYNVALNKINNELPAKLEATYKRVLAYAPNAQIYVAGYPQVIDNKSTTDPDDIRCPYMKDGSSKWADARAAHDITKKLNEKILARVTAVRAMNVDYQRLHFVDMNHTGSPFKGHEICGTEPTSWFLNLNAGLTNAAFVFHPNIYGQDGYATIIGAEID